MSSSTGSRWKKGNRVWVKTGTGDHEELGVILSVDASILVKLSTSGYELTVTDADFIRPMEVTTAEERDWKGRTLRRSGRSVNSSASANVGSPVTPATAVKFPAYPANVTPSPTEMESTSQGSSGSSRDDDGVKEDSKPAAKSAKRKRGASAAKAASTKKAKSDNGDGSSKGSPYFAKGSKKLTTGAKTVRGRKLMSASKEFSEDDEAEGGGEHSRKPALAKSKKKTEKKQAAAVTKKNASDEDTGEGKAPSKAQRAATTRARKKQPETKKTAAKKKAPAKRTKRSEAADVGPATVCVPVGSQPDGHGGLNQPSQPWTVEYSKSGRATCRTCDERIAKGEVRAGHAPLFRGKPGFMVYRHLRCAVFTEEIQSAEDVQNHEALSPDDYELLVEQVEISKVKLEEEQREIRPDELVQKTFEGEIRGRPEGMAATLLPFQVEGFSWMRHQEVEGEMRGGILADEMGMGKTIQAIATILDNRPKLQHAKPGMKHPPTDDLPQRQREERLWDEGKGDWSAEMELLKVPKKLRSRDGGARAGTLVICPVIALTQWRTEIAKFTEEEGTLKVCTYHGPDREKETPRELMKKYDVVLTTYQVLEADFRKMTSPNRVECPNCGGKFKIDKLQIHLKYFCGDNAQRTEAQARQVRNSERGGGGGTRRRRPGNALGRGGKGGSDKNGTKKKMSKSVDNGTKKKMKEKVEGKEEKKPLARKKKVTDDEKKKKSPAPKKPVKTPAKRQEKKLTNKAASTKKPLRRSGDSDEEERVALTPRTSRRSAAREAASRISRSAAEWAPGLEDIDSDDVDAQSDAEPSGDEIDEDSEEDISSDGSGNSSDSSGEDSVLERAREKQRQALDAGFPAKKESTKTQPAKKQPTKKHPAKKAPTIKNQMAVAKAKGKISNKTQAAKRKKNFDDDSDDNYSSDDSDSCDDAENEIDMKALLEKAMAGAKNSVLHSICWWRIVLDEAHFIKSRSSQTANAAFSLTGVHRWCLSGTPLQNRVGEFYSLVRFLRLDPMAYYYCRAKGCDCKSMHYRIHAGRCEGCDHGGIQHYSHFNKYILNPIQRDGYSGDGRRAMFLLKNEVLDKALLRRTKETRAADMELPPRLVQIKPVRLHPVEEDFYSALYTQTKSSFNDYVDSGTLLNNYAHIFDLLIRMRQSVDHPYLVVHSKKNAGRLALPGDVPAVANGSTDCDLCHEPPTDRVMSTCCGSAYCRACVLEYMATSQGMVSSSAGLACPSCRVAFSIDLQASANVEDDSSLTVPSVAKGIVSGSGMPSLRELKHVATGSILRRINLAEFATSSKIEALTRELVLMRRTSPGSKAIVFSQFVNMLDLIRWRLHSDPYLEDIGLGCRALHGGMNVKARDSCLKDFREDNNVRVLLMSLKAGGVALNLTCANYIYLMDPWWNPAAEMQAIDRTHRLGQYRPIRAVRFIAENTVEERILQLQEKKRLVFDGTVGRDAGSLKMLTVDDMKSLFA